MVDWLQLSSNSGIGTTNITITASTYSGLVDRITSLLVSGVTATSSVLITQERSYEPGGLTFEIISSGTITWTSISGITIDYAIGDTTFGTLSNGDSINVSAGDYVQFKATNQRYGTSNSYSYFGGTAYFNVSGNIMSLVYGENFGGQTELNQTYVFNGLFRLSNIVDASGLVLPARLITEGSYQNMFYACTSLTNAPSIISAQYMDRYACRYMFAYCSSLTTAPELPADVDGYDSSTSTSHSGVDCYTQMFYYCTALTTAPSGLPSTSLATACYTSMFAGCSALTTAPTLPAPTLVTRSYYYMFYGCSSLSAITCLATAVTATNCTNNWVTDVSSAGTFTKASTMSGWSTGNNGIPSGWTVVDAT